MLRLLNRLALAISLGFPIASLACGTRIDADGKLAEANRARESELVKLVAKDAEFVFVGAAISVEERADSSAEQDVKFQVKESLIGRPPKSVSAHLASIEAIPTCQESGWFRIPRNLAAGNTYIVYVGSDGRLLRAEFVGGRKIQNIPFESERAILLADGA